MLYILYITTLLYIGLSPFWLPLLASLIEWVDNYDKPVTYDGQYTNYYR